MKLNDFVNQIKQIEAAENLQAAEVNKLVKKLHKTGYKEESTEIAAAYMQSMRTFYNVVIKAAKI